MDRRICIGSLAAILAGPLAGCTTRVEVPSSVTMMQDYERAVRDAAVRTPDTRVPLRAIGPDQAMVSVASFTEWGVPATPLEWHTWVALPEQFREMCRGKPDPVLAIQQVLGLPPAPTPSRPDHRWQIVTFTVPREHIFRPCPGGTDIAAPSCVADPVSPDLDDAERRFFLGRLWSSDRVGFERRDNDGHITQDYGYPFTGMGWTYNWDPTSSTHVGVSEYVVKPGAPVRDATATTPDQFCNAPAAPPA